MYVTAQTAAQSPSMFRVMARDENERQRLLAEYALARVVYQLAREAVDRSSHDKNTMTAACLAEIHACERLVEVRRRMYQVRPPRNRPLSSTAPRRGQLTTQPSPRAR